MPQREEYGRVIAEMKGADVDKVNLAEKLTQIDEIYKPKVVAEYNDNKLVLCRARGEFVWHKHDDTDDCFLVLKGRLVIQLRDREVELNEGELYVVPRGVEHCPRADGEAEVLVIEPIGTVNTGDAEGSELTAEPERI
jgi:mannose-6-phosphate isomerase-like protein (cupin superfamily)